MVRTVCLLLLLTSSAIAQPRAAVPADSSLVAAHSPRTAADTVAAIHHLFAKHRHLGTIIVLGAVGADLALAGISAATEPTPAHSGSSGFGLSGPVGPHGFGAYAVLYAFLTLPVMGVGVAQQIGYATEREAKIVAAYETQHQLPASISRRLGRYLRKE